MQGSLGPKPPPCQGLGTHAGEFGTSEGRYWLNARPVTFGSPQPHPSSVSGALLETSEPVVAAVATATRSSYPLYLPACRSSETVSVPAAGCHCSLVGFGVFLGVLPFHRMAPACGSLTPRHDGAWSSIPFIDPSILLSES